MNFFLTNNQGIDNDSIFAEFANTLKSFWERRVKELFPNRNIIIEIGDAIMGEYGPTITLYEEVKVFL